MYGLLNNSFRTWTSSCIFSKNLFVRDDDLVWVGYCDGCSLKCCPHGGQFRVQIFVRDNCSSGRILRSIFQADPFKDWRRIVDIIPGVTSDEGFPAPLLWWGVTDLYFCCLLRAALAVEWQRWLLFRRCFTLVREGWNGREWYSLLQNERHDDITTWLWLECCRIYCSGRTYILCVLDGAVMIYVTSEWKSFIREYNNSYREDIL